MTGLTAFDADVLIYAASKGHPLGRRVTPLFQRDAQAGIGSVLLLPEVLTKPLRQDPESDESVMLLGLLSRLDLLPLNERTARLALSLALRYGLRAADATHLATAVAAGADRFLTNNRKDFPRTVSEIEVVYPGDLASPADARMER